jgi:hypothetical protein
MRGRDRGEGHRNVAAEEIDDRRASPLVEEFYRVPSWLKIRVISVACGNEARQMSSRCPFQLSLRGAARDSMVLRAGESMIFLVWARSNQHSNIFRRQSG